jgi:predicted GH43/DUF377 family glycosyl hydrolase
LTLIIILKCHPMIPKVKACLFSKLLLFICLLFPALTIIGQNVEAGNEFKIRVPDQMLPLPFPLKPGEKPGFSLRGIKGYNWTPEQYLEEIPFLAEYKANFLMNCYLSMFTPRKNIVFKYGNFLDSIENTWRSPIPDEKRTAYEKIFKECKNKGINFCFSMHPQLFAESPLDPGSESDFQLLLKHYQWAQQKGVKWFAVCLDDIDENQVSVSGTAHAILVNKLYSALRKEDQGVKMIFCPTYYWGTGTDNQSAPYLEALGEKLNPDIYVFWTGPEVVPKHITAEDANSYRKVVKHKIILWENYPVNDNHPTIHLGPVTGRDPGLGKIVDGYMVNPLGKQNHINRIPLLTCLDYAFNPVAYEAGRSIGQAILHLADTQEKQQILARLVETYPGELIFQKDKSERGLVGLNPVRERFRHFDNSGTTSGTIKNYVMELEKLSENLNQEFNGQFGDAVSLIKRDILWIRRNMSETLPGPADPVSRIKLLPPSQGNPRNSEGDFIRLNDNRIMFIYTHFTGGAGDDAGAYLAARYSGDNGKTWSDKDVVVVANEGKNNIMSVSLQRLNDNSIALFYLRKNSITDCRMYMRVSKDEGRTWSKPALCFKDYKGYYVVNNDRVVLLSGGRLIAPAALHNTPQQNKFENSAAIVFYYSDNDGKTWKRSKTVIKNKDVILQEPGVVELNDGRIMMFCRTDAGYQYISYSNDKGDTWTDCKPSEIMSPLSPASIERIPSTGDLMMVWNNRKPSPGEEGKRTPLNIAISDDDGISWKNIRTIENDPDGWYCYTAIEFIDDKVFLAYCAGDRRNSNGLETTQITTFPVNWLYESDVSPELVSLKMIWNKAPHNAFTDLVRYNDKWYCTFREGEKHVGGDGRIRVIVSSDGETWESAALFEIEGIDLRDPKLSITPANKLMLHIGGSIYAGGKRTGFSPAVAFMDKAGIWSGLSEINIKDKWPWRPFWMGETAYCVAYDTVASLYRTDDGIRYEKIIGLEPHNFPNEAAFCKGPGDTLMLLLRRETGDRHAWTGRAVSPYTEWKWKDSNWSLGGPALINVPGKGIFAGGRCTFDKMSRTVIGKITEHGFFPLFILPSGGDCSYPGLVYHEGFLWVSYYSTHNNNTSIYLAKFRIGNPKN